jgi:hypothetical protein
MSKVTLFIAKGDAWTSPLSPEVRDVRKQATLRILRYKEAASSSFKRRPKLRSFHTMIQAALLPAIKDGWTRNMLGRSRRCIGTSTGMRYIEYLPNDV